SASIQFAATDPDARTNCRTSSTLLIVLGNCLTKRRIDSANRNVRSSRSRRFAPSSIFAFWNFTWDLGFGICDLRSQRQRPLSAPHQRDRPLRSARRHFLSATAFLSQHLFPRDERSTAQIA